ncbi:MAG TPA: L-glutamate gamma-semialdehyde dehydrogenase [Balneolales bacterium]|nr:L-glutamate gamma-semialdehyde dehydrogenase [Balneolales bacterium]
MPDNVREKYYNQGHLDFSVDTNDKALKAAIQEARSNFGKEYDLYIDGKWVKGDKGTFESKNPSNLDEVIGVFQKASKEQARKALQSAWKAFETWQYVSAEERAEYLFKAAEIAQRRRMEINAWMISEAGKNYVEADADTAEGIDFLNYYAHQALRLDKGMEIVEDTWGDKNRTIYTPIGAGVSISPWNFPFAICLGVAVAPIAAGCTVVSKPAPDTPKMGHIIAEILEEAGLPAGVYNYVTGEDLEVGETLVQDPDTRFISFTGSKKVGLHIYESAGKTKENQRFLKRVLAEMGGKNAVVVDSDSDLEAAAEGIVKSAYGFQGQKCSAGSRAIVMEDVYDDVVDKVVERVKDLVVGNAKDNPNLGPVINQKAVDKIMSYIEVGKSEGTLLAGGKRAKMENEGYYIEPTVFKDVDPHARIAQEEIFGPVLAFIKAKDLDDAIRIANDTDYGLTGGFFSYNTDHIDRVLREVKVGNLYINRGCTGSLVGAQPFGGFKLSGTDAKAGGRDYLLYFMEAKSLTEHPVDGQDLMIYKFSYCKKGEPVK